MTLSPLAFFDLLEEQKASWLPALEAEAAWVFERRMYFAEKRGELRVLRRVQGGSAAIVLSVRAREIAGVGLNGSTDSPAGSPGTPWVFPFCPAPELTARVLELTQTWQPQITEALMPFSSPHATPSSAAAPPIGPADPTGS